MIKKEKALEILVHNSEIKTKATEILLGLRVKKVVYDIEDRFTRYCRHNEEYIVVDSTFKNKTLYYVIQKTNSKETVEIEANCFTPIEIEETV